MPRVKQRTPELRDRVLDVAVHGTASRHASGQWVGHLRVQAHLTGELRFAALTVKVTGRGASASVGVPATDWTEADLDKYLTSPSKFLPGTTKTIVGIADAKERGDIIAAMKSGR